MMRMLAPRNWPIVFTTAFFLALIVCIGPWSELPLNDDWQYAHLAKNLAERGTFTVDVAVAPTVVGQSLVAWPVIRAFGFSHLALRLLTLGLSILILIELDYLLSRAAVSAGIRFVALCTVVANPLFLHFSTTFMTENYGYFVALLAACVWFYGRQRNRATFGVLAAAIAGFSFWIRQSSALVFPALLLAEFIAAGGRRGNLRPLVVRRALAVAMWVAITMAYFPWARATGNYAPRFSEAYARIFSVDPRMVLVESGVYLFYLTIFFAPFLFAAIRRERPPLKAYLIPALLLLTAAIALRYGVTTNSPANLRSIFPFLANVFTSYGVGPVTLTDVYRDNAQIRPRVSEIPWMALEAAAIALSLGWARALMLVRTQKNEVGVFGICFALMSFAVVVQSFKYGTFDRYHYPGILGFSLALAAFCPRGNERRLRRAAVVWVGVSAIFSTLSLHDYFRWNEARAELLTQAQRRGISLSQIDAGYEPNGWYSVEGVAATVGCGPDVSWFCSTRPFRIGLEQRPSDRLILSRPVDAWLVKFPEVKLLRRR